MKRTFILSLFILSTACFQGVQTPEYGIYLSGSDDTQSTDLAWALAAQLGGMDPHKAINQAQEVNLSVQSTPITYSDSSLKYHGLSINQDGMVMDRIQLVGESMLDSETPTVHEFLHTILWLKTGNQDDGHTDPAWKCSGLDYASDPGVLNICMHDNGLAY